MGRIVTTARRAAGGYCAGVDLGTANTRAVAARPAEAASPGDDLAAVVISSALYVAPDGRVSSGDVAMRRRSTDPGRVVQAYGRRIGDATPMVVGGTPVQAHLLVAHQLRGVIERLTRARDAPPAALAVTHPAGWSRAELDSLHLAVDVAGLGDVPALYVSEPEAAAVAYSSHAPSTSDRLIAVYDFGATRFDATVMRSNGTGGFEIVGRPRHIEQVGGVDLDSALVEWVDDRVRGAVSALDEGDPDAVRLYEELRLACVGAKEALSSADETTIPVTLPGQRRDITITRAEFEAAAGSAIGTTIDALHEALGEAGVESSDLDAVVLVGGSSRIPMVAHQVQRVMATRSGSRAADRRQPTVAAIETGATVARGAAHAGARRLPALPRPAPEDRPGTDPPPAADHEPGHEQPIDDRASPPIRPRRRRVVAGVVCAVLVGAGALGVMAANGVGPDPFGWSADGAGAAPPLAPVVDRGDAWLRAGLLGGIAKIDVEAHEVVANVPINGADTTLHTSPSGPLVTDDSVWAAIRDRQEGPVVYLIDREQATIRQRIPLGVDDLQLVPLGLARTEDGIWATFVRSGGEALAARLDASGVVVATAELQLLESATPVSDGASLFAVAADGGLVRVAPDGKVDHGDLDDTLGAVAYSEGVLHAFGATAVYGVDPVDLGIDGTAEYRRDGRPFELSTEDGAPVLAAVEIADGTAAFATFDDGEIVNVLSLDVVSGEVATVDELPIGGATVAQLPANSVTRVGPGGEIWVDVMQSLVRIEDGASELISIENPLNAAAVTQDLAVVRDGLVRNDTDDQGFSTVTIFDRGEREVSAVRPLIDRTISPLFEGGRFWAFEELRGPVAVVDADRQVLGGQLVTLDGISAGPMEVAGEVWAVTFKTNDPHDTDDNERELTILDPEDGSVIERRPYPFAGSLLVDGDEVWVSGDDFVKIDPETLEEQSRVPSSGYQITPNGFAFGMGIPDDIGHGAIWDLAESGVRRIDTTSLAVTETTLEGQPFSATVAGDWAWVSTVDGVLYRLDPATGEIAGSVDVGDELIEVAVAGSAAFAVEIDGGHVHRIELSDDGSDSVVAVADIEFGPVTWRAHEGYLWVANAANGRVHQIDQTGEIAKTLLLDGRPAVIASDGESSLLVGLQDKRALSLIDVGMRGELAEIPLGEG